MPQKTISETESVDSRSDCKGMCSLILIYTVHKMIQNIAQLPGWELTREQLRYRRSFFTGKADHHENDENDYMYKAFNYISGRLPKLSR